MTKTDDPTAEGLPSLIDAPGRSLRFPDERSVLEAMVSLLGDVPNFLEDIAGEVAEGEPLPEHKHIPEDSVDHGRRVWRIAHFNTWRDREASQLAALGTTEQARRVGAVDAARLIAHKVEHIRIWIPLARRLDLAVDADECLTEVSITEDRRREIVRSLHDAREKQDPGGVFVAAITDYEDRRRFQPGLDRHDWAPREVDGVTTGEDIDRREKRSGAAI